MQSEHGNGVDDERAVRSSETEAKRPRRRFGRSWWWIALAVIGLYAGVSVLAGWLQSKLLYFPARGYESTPADIGLTFEELTLRTADDVTIAAWYVPHPSPMGTIIFCHGNAGNIGDEVSDIDRLHSLGLNILIFDYRGYGRSEGVPSEQGTYADADAAWTYVVETRGESPDRVVVFGRSLGGAVAIELATRHRLAALIVESTFTNLVDVGRLHYPWLPVNWLVTYRYESIAKVGRITCSKLFFHGSDDTLIPIEIGRRLFSAAAEPKTFVETPGRHNEAGYSYAPEFNERLAAFLNQVLGEVP